MTDLGPGIHSLGHGKGGHVHAFLIENGNELTLVDTLFESDGRLVLDEIRRLGRKPTDRWSISRRSTSCGRESAASRATTSSGGSST